MVGILAQYREAVRGEGLGQCDDSLQVGPSVGHGDQKIDWFVGLFQQDLGFAARRAFEAPH